MTESRAQTSGLPRVLVVCTGNLCRSPLVEALLRAELADAGIEAEVSSAGTGAPLDREPDRKLVRVADELGVDVREHRSRPVTRELLDGADLVLTMTRRQVDQLADLDEAAAARAVPLKVAVWKARSLGRQHVSFASWVTGLTADVPLAERARSSRADDIPDPIGRPLRHYRAMGRDVDDLVRSLVREWPQTPHPPA